MFLFVVAGIALALCVLYFLMKDRDNAEEHNANALVTLGKVEAKVEELQKELEHWKREAANGYEMWKQEKAKNDVVISQKKSSETRLGQITEHLVPFLEGFRHNPKDCHFLGQPIDLIAFDYDEGAITFIEVKTGGAKESARQKTIKNIIKSGKVFYERYTLNDKGLKVKTEENNQ